MSLSDKLKRLAGKAEKAGAGHKAQLEKVVDKAETAADQRTQGKYTSQIRKVGAKADDYVEGLKPADEPPQAPPPSQAPPSPQP